MVDLPKEIPDLAGIHFAQFVDVLGLDRGREPFVRDLLEVAVNLRPLEVLEDVVPVRLLPTVVAEVRGGLARQDADRGRLADPVRPEEADHLALLRDRDPEQSKGVLPVLMDEIFFECFREADDPNRVERAFADTVMDDLPGRRICLVLLDFEIENLQALHPSRFNAPDRGVNELLVHEIVTGLSITTVGKADLKYPRQLCRKFSGYCKAVHATLARRGTRRYPGSDSETAQDFLQLVRKVTRRGDNPEVIAMVTPVSVAPPKPAN